MNFKKLAEQKIDELSGKTSKKDSENDSIDLVLEGLDEELSLENNEETFELDLNEDDFEFSSEQSKKVQVENLFDGYLGEKSETPNPLEYGPNATYRNLREGVVYKKGPDNLWETFVKDGVAGRNGQSAPGGGCGVAEVTKIATDIITTNQNKKSTLTRRLRVSTFGDSTDNISTGTNQNFEAWSIATPTSGTNSQSLNILAAPNVFKTDKIRYVFNGGISGQTTIQMLNRTSAAYSTSRKSVYDLIQTSPDIVFVHGLSINDLTSMDENTPLSAVDLVVDNCLSIINLLKENVPLVIHTGIYGYSGSVSANKLNAIRQIITYCNNKFETASKLTKNHIFINPNGIFSLDGVFIPGYSDDGTHLNVKSSRILADVETNIVDTYYDILCSNKKTYDFIKDWYNGSTNPINCTSPTYGSPTVNSTSIKKFIWEKNITTTTSADGVIFTINSLENAISGLTSATSFYYTIKYEVVDLIGNNTEHIITSNISLYDNNNIGRAVYTVANGQVSTSDGLVSFPNITLDYNGSYYGANSNITISINPIVPSTYLIRVYPINVMVGE